MPNCCINPDRLAGKLPANCTNFHEKIGEIRQRPDLIANHQKWQNFGRFHGRQSQRTA
jgi:hypothetical protein